MTDVPIYNLPLPAGLPRRVGDILAHDASWSPNGEQIVYAHGNELFLAKPDGSENRRLVTLSGPASWIRWSPDGKVLRFTIDDMNVGWSESLWEVASDGTGLHPLLLHGSRPTEQCCGNWTPDGNYFVFQSDQGFNEITLWAIREKSGFLRRRNPEPIQLTTAQSNMFSPVPSRDGKKLFAIQGASQGELVRYDAKSQQFVPYLSGISAIQLRLFERWAVGRLYESPRLDSVAKQSGRNGAASAHFSSSWLPVRRNGPPMGSRLHSLPLCRARPCIFISCRQMAEPPEK